MEGTVSASTGGGVVSARSVEVVVTVSMGVSAARVRSVEGAASVCMDTSALCAKSAQVLILVVLSRCNWTDTKCAKVLFGQRYYKTKVLSGTESEIL